MPLSSKTILFSPQGLIMVGKRDETTGAVHKYIDLGNAPKLSVSLSTETEEIKESMTGQRLPMARMEKSKGATVEIELHNFDKRTLELLVRASPQTVNSGTVTGETLPEGLVAGDVAMLSNPFVSGVVIKDSALTPATVAPEDYVVDAGGGMIRIVDPTGYVQPFKVDYTHAKQEVVALFTQGRAGYSLVFSGVNTARSNEPLRVELYNIEFDPVENLDLIAEEANKFSLKGSLLIDPTKDGDDPELGQFGRIIRKAP